MVILRAEGIHSLFRRGGERWAVWGEEDTTHAVWAMATLGFTPVATVPQLVLWVQVHRKDRGAPGRALCFGGMRVPAPVA